MSQLTFEQLEAVRCFERPVAVVAAAGSGKTTVLVERYLECLQRGLTPDEILCVTFTNEAALQLRERIASRLRGTLSESDPLLSKIESTPYIGTLHSFGLGLLRSYGASRGYPPVQRILDQFDAAEIFAISFDTWMRECDRETLAAILGEKRPTELRSLARAAFNRRNRFLHEVGDRSEPLRAALAEWIDRLQRSLHQRGLYSFDDLESIAIELVEHNPLVAEAVRSQFGAVLVDEFQDTSPEQWRLLRGISSDRMHKLFVVGDPKQSIYAFRGADIRVYLDAAAELSGGNDPFELSTTYRAHPELVGWVNQFADRLFHGTEVPFSPMRAGRSETHEAQSTRISFTRCTDTAEELEAAVRSVQERITRGARPRDIAFLFRVSDRITEGMERLRAVGIPVRCSRSESLFEQYAVRDVCSYLKAFAKPQDNAVLAAFLRTPYAGFSEQDLLELRQDRSRDLYTSWSFHPELRHRARWFRTLAESGEIGLTPVIQQLWSASGHLPRRTDALVHFIDPLLTRASSVYEAVDKLEAWEREAILHTSKLEDSDDAVSLLTVHGSKGLEFDHVYLMDLARRSPNQSPLLVFSSGRPVAFKDEASDSPYAQAQNEVRIAQRDESRRLLYVALTRARESISVFLPPSTAKVPGESWAALFENAGDAPSNLF